jgi:hypothetical protein
MQKPKAQKAPLKPHYIPVHDVVFSNGLSGKAQESISYYMITYLNVGSSSTKALFFSVNPAWEAAVPPLLWAID